MARSFAFEFWPAPDNYEAAAKERDSMRAMQREQCERWKRTRLSGYEKFAMLKFSSKEEVK